VTVENQDRQQGTQPENQPPQPPPEGQPAAVHADPPPISSPAEDPPDSAADAGDGNPASAPSNGKVHHLAEGTFKRLKETERAKGRKEALDEFAKEQGFESADAMKAAFERRNQRRQQRDDPDKKPPKRAATKSRTPVDDPPDETDAGGDKHLKQLNRNMRKLERRVEESETKNADLARRMQREAAAKKRAERERDALEAEMAVRVSAAQAGIRDSDYAMRLLTKELQGKGDEDLAKFDEASFFSGLRETHPYLFGETTQPANTGNGAGSAPGAPNPGAAQVSAAQGGKIDARKMSREEYRQLLRDRGLNVTG